MMDYEVVWDGAHHGQDRDLLAEGLRVAEKVTAPPDRPRPGYAKAAVFEVLPVQQTRALTFHQLVAVTGLHPQAVTSALYQLRQDGLLRAEPMLGERPSLRAPKLYWRWPA